VKEYRLEGSSLAVSARAFQVAFGGSMNLLLGNAFLLVVFLDISLGRFLFLHDANEACNLPSDAIADATAATEICRRGDHE
jgi:hypothetical protein